MYNSRIHCSASQTPFSFALSRPPPGVTLLETCSAFSIGVYAKTFMHVLRSRLEERVRTLRAKADANMASAQQRSKRNYSRQARVTTTFQFGNRVFIDVTPLATELNTDATRTALSTYDEIIPHSLRPFLVIVGRPHSLVIDNRKIENVAPTDRATRAPHPECLDTTDSLHIRQQDENDLNPSQQSV